MSLNLSGSGNISGLQTSGGAFPSGVAAEPYAFCATLGNVNQSINHNTVTKILYNTEEYDAGSCYDAVNSRFVTPVTGLYHFDVVFGFDSSTISAGIPIIGWFYKNGSYIRRNIMRTSSGGNEGVVFSVDIKLETNDLIDIYVRQDAGGTRTLNGDPTISWFNGHLIRAGSF